MVRYRRRLIAGVLAAGFPITLLLVVIVTGTATSSVTDACDRVLVELAQRVAGDVDRFTFERHRDLQQYAAAFDHRVDASAADVLSHVQAASTAFKVVELLDPQGHFVAAAPPTDAFAPGSRTWFSDALQGSVGASPRYRAGDITRWVVAEPVRDADNRIVGVLAGDVEPRSLDAVIRDAAPSRGRVVLVDHDRVAVAAAGAGRFRTPTRMVTASVAASAGALHTGSIVAGVAPVHSTGWGVVAAQPRGVALHAVSALRGTAIRGTAIALVLYVAFAWLFARGEEWRLRAIVEQRVAAARTGSETPTHV